MEHVCRRAGVWLAVALVAAIALALPAAPARAIGSTYYKQCQYVLDAGPKKNYKLWRFCLGIVLPLLETDGPEGAAGKTAKSGPRGATYILTNQGSAPAKDEPDFGGLMKATTWGVIQSDRAQRVTLHTFGSDIDTVLAAYHIKHGKGTKFSYELIKGNDDTAVPGVGRGWSLVTVDLKKGEDYHVQIGGQNGAETDRIAFTATAFGPDGGVSAFLLSTTAGSTMQGRDYVCEQRPCPSATFILHNSAKTSARVTPSTTGLSGFFKNPAPVTIAPGGLASVTFTGLPFSNAGGVAASGAFTFAATADGKAFESVEKPATVFIIDPLDQAEGLEMSAKDRLEVGELNERMRFQVALKNTASTEARRCSFRSLQANFRNVLTRFRTTSTSGKPTGHWGEPADIPAGKTQDFEVEIASMASRRGDPAFGLADEVGGACVNRVSLGPDLLGTLEINADGSSTYSVVDAKLSGGDSLAVPSGGEASFDVTGVNTFRDAAINARPVYVYPPNAYDPDQLYGVSVCRLDKKKRCDGAKSFIAPWAAKKGDKATFRVFVKAPKEKPPSDPGQFRVYLKFEGQADEWSNLFGATSVAVKVK